MSTIGIVACTYEGASLCYQTICRQAPAYSAPYAHPEIILHNHSLQQYMQFIDKDNWQGVAGLLLSSARKLVASGATVLICPDNTIHQAFPYLPALEIPWLHIAEEVTKVAAAKQFKKVGILGTKYLMEGPVYPAWLAKQSIQYEVPELSQRAQVNEIIFNELVNGEIKEASKQVLLAIIDRLKAKGCDAVILGCTELPLIVFPHESPLPVLDSTRILAQAALHFVYRTTTGV